MNKKTNPVKISTHLPENIISFMFYFMDKKTGFFLAILFLSAVVETVILLSFTNILKSFVDRATELGDNASFSDFYDLLKILLILLVLFSINALARIISWQKGRQPYELGMRRKLFKFTHNHAHSFFASNQAGNIAHKIMDVPYSFVLTFADVAFDLLPSMIILLISFIWFWSVSDILGAVCLIWSLIYLTFTIIISLKAVNLNRKSSEAKSVSAGIIVDSIANNMAVRLFSSQNKEEEILGKNIEKEIKYKNLYYNIWKWQAIFQKTMLIIFFMFSMSYSLYGFSAGQFTIGDLAMITSIILLITLRIDYLGELIMIASESVGSIKNGIKLLNQPFDVQDKENAKDITLTTAQIKFKEVEFHYSENTDIQVLKNFNLTITEGEKIGLVGNSGAGKSTIINLLLRLYDINKGTISINNYDISEITQESLRNNISVIPQDTILFHRTLIENIRYGKPDATDDEVISAAKKAYAHDFIKQLPQGYETLVGERGVKLSGGQRQRIAIARAILKDTPILILDEATSALDSESEALIQASLKDLMQGKTVIAIAHRLSTINQLDRLIVMDKGKIVEDGTHEELLKRKGLYAKLWSMQSGGFLQE